MKKRFAILRKSNTDKYTEVKDVKFLSDVHEYLDSYVDVSKFAIWDREQNLTVFANDFMESYDEEKEMDDLSQI